MRLILPLFFCFLMYLGCANKSSNELLVVKKEKPIPIKKEIVRGWKNQNSRKIYLQSIRNAASEGLLSEDYNSKSLEVYENVYDKLSDKEIETYHKLLSSSFIKFTAHLFRGKLNPTEIYPDWDIKRRKFKADSLLNLAIDSLQIESIIEDCKPKSNIYKYLKKSLAIINSLPKENFKNIVSKKKFNIGDNDKAIIQIKKRLQYWKDLSPKDSLKSVYNDDMLQAVKQFQARHGLEPDGVIGAGTLTALNVTKEIRKQQIIANLERWRWYPRDLGLNHVVVNIPNYYLHTVQDVDTTKTFKVVVGTEKRKTPILSSKIDNIVFNPTWTVPPTIMKEDLIPGISKDRKYITNRKITIYNRKGKEVSLGDWRYSNAEDYKYVQEPGENNALGFVKINFPNNHMVYLHDTNHRDYFVKNFRSLSSGCVRVENPLELAEYLLYNKPENYNATKIDSILFFKKTKTVKIEEEIQVHILYFTAWYQNGLLQFRNDIYAYDPELYLRLSNQFTSNLVTSARVVNK